MKAIKYNPDIELLDKIFNTNKIHFNFPFFKVEKKPKQNKKQNKLNPEKYNQVKDFCDKWDINTSHVSNIYYIIDKLLPLPVLQAFQKIATENQKRNDELMEIIKLKDLGLVEIIIRREEKRKGILIKDSLNLKEIKSLLVEYAEVNQITEEYKFTSEAFKNLSKSFDKYFLHFGIETKNFKRRCIIIGHLLILAGLPPNKLVKEEGYDDQMLSDVIRNWIKRSKNQVVTN